MDLPADDPYRTPAIPSGLDLILSEANQIKAGIRRDRRWKIASYGLAVFSFVPAPLFMCACAPSSTLLGSIAQNPESFALLAVSLIGLFSGIYLNHRISRARQELDALAERHEAGLPY